MPVVPPSAAVEAAILGPSTIVTRRVEIYEADAQTLWAKIDSTSRLTGGSISVDGTRDERRSLDLTLDNMDGLLKPDPNGFWYDKILKVYRGVLAGSTAYEAQVGEFMIDRMDQSHFPRDIKITGRDYTKKLLLSKFPQPITFTEGQLVEDLVRNIASNGGISKFVLPVTGKITGKDFTFDKGVARWEALNEIVTAYGYELFFDAQGYLTMREYQDPVTSPSVYVFETGQFGNLVSYSKSTNDTRIYNHVAVTGGDADSIPVYAEALNTEPTSPTSIAKIGDRLYEYSSPFITTVDQAQDVANKFLSIHALESYEFGFDAIVLPWLEANSIIDFYDPDPAPGDPTRFLMDTLDIPLGLDAMSATAKRVTIVSSTGY